ncbi:hypothetical protein OZX56_08235 [Lactobacillus sp. ESL0684]|uniref:hypothetical protein n=1 Tax=Lactobacillus sp. ESL0684 TaxID=2983213 RepID=UPI0023F8A492|nr:hypothetical protein [Lactobacillus sp. ESL0684]WEV43480.1 hypothetical protein OZX56_08235 [Lactobacillus sp. ESL0684]
MNKDKQKSLINFLDSITQNPLDYKYETVLDNIIVYVYSLQDFHTVLGWCGSWGAYFTFSTVEQPDDTHKVEYQIEITDYDKDLSKYV